MSLQLQLQARALGDPTRYEIFRYLADADRAVGVAELTTHLGLHHNAVRQHLARLVDADLAVESVAPASGRGRPPLHYVVAPAGAGRWGVVGSYERLAVLLAEVVRTGEDPVVVGRRAGRRQPVGTVASPPVDALVEQMARLGFDPTVRRRRGGIDVTLHTCPFTSAVLADADAVCGLHLGLAQGMADAIGGLVVDELVIEDPRRAQCRLRCRPLPAGGAGSTG